MKLTPAERRILIEALQTQHATVSEALVIAVNRYPEAAICDRYRSLLTLSESLQERLTRPSMENV